MPEMTYDPEAHAYTVDGKRVPSVTEIAGVLTAGKYSAMNPAILEQAKRRGTLVHEYCEAIDCGVEPEDLDIEPELIGYVNAYLAFLRDWAPEWDYIEKPVWTSEYAGRADRIGRIDGKTVIVDIKTTASMDRLSKLALLLQLYGYANAWSVMGKGSTRECFGLQLKKDGTYTIHYDYAIEAKYIPDFSVPGLWSICLNITKIIGGYNT